MYTTNMSELSFLEYKLNSSKSNKLRYMYLTTGLFAVRRLASQERTDVLYRVTKRLQVWMSTVFVLTSAILKHMISIDSHNNNQAKTK